MPNPVRPCLGRLMVLDQLIRQGTYPNTRTAARRLEVASRTIFRDLSFLRDSWGAPLEFDAQRNGFYYRDADYVLPCHRLTEGELVALFLAERLLQAYEGTPCSADLARLFDKLTTLLPDEITIHLGHLSGALSFRQRTMGAGDAETFALLTRALRESRRLEVVYWTASRDEVQERLLDPYHLMSMEGRWYLVAWCHLRQQVLMFMPSRFRSVRDTEESFERPTGFSIEAYLASSFGVMRQEGPPVAVVLRFGPVASRYVREERWHPSQEVEEEPDGGLTMRLEVGHLLELKRWVMSWGADGVVLEPAAFPRRWRWNTPRRNNIAWGRGGGTVPSSVGSVDSG